MKLKMVALSDIGNVRKNNEDMYLINEEKQFALVCDGMGGHQAGQEASRLACETIYDLALANSNELMNELAQEVNHDLPAGAAQMVSALRMANSRIFLEANKRSELKGMGTTATAIQFDEGQVFIAHVGDSRAYRIRNGKIQRLTEDHTWLNELIQDNEIAEDEVDSFERKNVITRAVGLSPRIKVDITTDIAQNGDLYLLCSDGLTDSLKDDMIHQIIGLDGDIELSAACLIAKAKELKGTDNITAILIKVLKTDEVNPSLGFRKVIVAEEDEKAVLKESKFVKQLYGGKRITNEKGQIIITPQANKMRAIWEIVGGVILLILVTFFAIQAHQAKEAVKASGITADEPFVDEVMLDSSMEMVVSGGLAGNSAKGILALVYFENLPAFIKYTYPIKSSVLDTLLVVPAIFNRRESVDIFVRDSANKLLYANTKYPYSVLAMQANSGNRGGSSQALNNQRRFSGRLTPEPNSGIIYLAGYEKSRKYQETILYLNDRQVGKLNDFLATGVRVLPGTYKISIQDTTGRIIQRKEDVTITPGGQKILEAD